MKFTVSVGEFFGLKLPHFVATIATTRNANRDVINVMSVAVDLSHLSFILVV